MSVKLILTLDPLPPLLDNREWERKLSGSLKSKSMSNLLVMWVEGLLGTLCTVGSQCPSCVTVDPEMSPRVSLPIHSLNEDFKMKNANIKMYLAYRTNSRNKYYIAPGQFMTLQ